jgi:hypothetical protein
VVPWQSSRHTPDNSTCRGEFSFFFYSAKHIQSHRKNLEYWRIITNVERIAKTNTIWAMLKELWMVYDHLRWHLYNISYLLWMVHDHLRWYLLITNLKSLFIRFWTIMSNQLTTKKLILIIMFSCMCSFVLFNKSKLYKLYTTIYHLWSLSSLCFC